MSSTGTTTPGGGALPQWWHAEFPSVVMYDKPAKKGARAKPVQHLLWGDWVSAPEEKDGDWWHVWSRGAKGWLHKGCLRRERILEVVFVDVGQGDGCLVVTPQDKHLLIDAGVGDNMFRFLRWRYNKFQKKWTFQAAVLSHPDSDHYQGFSHFFKKKPVKGVENVFFEALYHNGLVERKAKKETESLGATAKEGKRMYVTEVVEDQAALEELLEKESNWKGKAYPTLLKRALESKRVGRIEMLSAESRYLPGYSPADANGGVVIEALGPVVEQDAGGGKRLRWLGDVGKTKNGHSVVLRLRYKDVRLLLGGDLNTEAENLLMEHYAPGQAPPGPGEPDNPFIQAARQTFEVEVAKSCHHGSGDFSETFLRVTNPIATVVSSGDNEPHSHPRADALGAMGRWGRGERPLIFSTELARSPSELKKQAKVKAAAAGGEPAGEKARDRAIAIYGAIHLRTDGERLVLAQRVERPQHKDRLWDLYVLERDAGGAWRYNRAAPAKCAPGKTS